GVGKRKRNESEAKGHNDDLTLNAHSIKSSRRSSKECAEVTTHSNTVPYIGCSAYGPSNVILHPIYDRKKIAKLI
ncbi:MAG TPA: hypothetical protein DIW81_12935, partial [Planctomycetaceae bacterium]|nr:hypothetical protein [Planctomycetaceae bacterium]